jgi:hypothetical protein
MIEPLSEMQLVTLHLLGYYFYHFFKIPMLLNKCSTDLHLSLLCILLLLCLCRFSCLQLLLSVFMVCPPHRLCSIFFYSSMFCLSRSISSLYFSTNFGINVL